MQPIVIIIHPPTIHNISQLIDMEKQLSVQQLIPQLLIE